MGEASASSSASSTSGFSVDDSGNINYTPPSEFAWLKWVVLGVVCLFALAVWMRTRNKTLP